MSLSSLKPIWSSAFFIYLIAIIFFKIYYFYKNYNKKLFLNSNALFYIPIVLVKKITKIFTVAQNCYLIVFLWKF